MRGALALKIRTFLTVNILLAASVLAAEADSTKGQAAAGDGIPVKSLPVDPQKLVGEINGSYYHPDQLSEVKCAVAFDWSSFFSSLNAKVSDARMRSLNALQIHYTATRGKRTDVKFNWVDGRADTADQLEDGIQQIISGFYQSYWPLMASSPIAKASEIRRIEPQSDGTSKIFESDENNKVEIALDKNFAPAHWSFDSPAFKGAFDLEFKDSPTPVAGDLRRLSDLHVVTNTGANTMNVQIKLNYQSVDGVNIPQHVTYDIVGAYSISLEFIGCSIAKNPDSIAAPAQ